MMICYFVSLVLLSASDMPEYKVAFVEHPRLLFTKAELPDIRQRIERQSWAKQAYAGIARNAESWLDRKVVLPDRGGQWWHWYSCKKDGAALRTKSDTEHVCPVCGTKIFRIGKS